MGLLNRIFGSSESISGETAADEESIIESWEKYLNTIPEKEQIISRLPYSFGERKALLLRIRQLLDLDLAEVFTAEREEDGIVLNLRSLEHSKKIKRVHRLEDCLRYFETRHEYVYELLRHLYSVLKSEAYWLEKLRKHVNLRTFRKLVGLLKSELAVEKAIVEKIGDLRTFRDIFFALGKGEYIIRKMDSGEKRLLTKMQKGIGKIFSNEITEGITREWAITVFDKVEDKVHEGVANRLFPGYHPYIDLEFSNRPEFVELVREVIQSIRRRKVSERMVNVFVHLFREWYNHEKD